MKTSIRQNFDLETRSSMTKVNAEISLTVDGKELPAMGVLGEAMENAIRNIQKDIKESYVTVPARI